MLSWRYSIMFIKNSYNNRTIHMSLNNSYRSVKCYTELIVIFTFHVKRFWPAEEVIVIINAESNYCCFTGIVSCISSPMTPIRLCLHTQITVIIIKMRPKSIINFFDKPLSVLSTIINTNTSNYNRIHVYFF